jgi:hypothetical protein
MALKDIQVISPGTCENCFIWNKKDFADVIKDLKVVRLCWIDWWAQM